MNPYFCDKGQRPANFDYDNAFDAGVDGNVTKTVIGFWLRRSMDGTMDTFAEGLKKLLAAYQPDLMTAPARSARSGGVDARDRRRASEAPPRARIRGQRPPPRPSRSPSRPTGASLRG